MVNVILCVDCSTYRMLIESNEVSKADRIYVVNVVTSFDVLNEDTNAGSLAMNEWSACLRQQGYNVHTQQIVAVNTNSALMDFCEEVEAKHVFLGDSTFSSTNPEESGLVANIFSHAKRALIGSAAEYLQPLKEKGVEVHVACDSIRIIEDPEAGHLEKISKLELNIVERPFDRVTDEDKRSLKLIADWNTELSISPRLRFSECDERSQKEPAIPVAKEGK